MTFFESTIARMKDAGRRTKMVLDTEGENSDVMQDMAKHDKQFHPSGFKPGNKCKFRDELKSKLLGQGMPSQKVSQLLHSAGGSSSPASGQAIEKEDTVALQQGASKQNRSRRELRVKEISKTGSKINVAREVDSAVKLAELAGEDKTGRVAQKIKEEIKKVEQDPTTSHETKKACSALLGEIENNTGQAQVPSQKDQVERKPHGGNLPKPPSPERKEENNPQNFPPKLEEYEWGPQFSKDGNVRVYTQTMQELYAKAKTDARRQEILDAYQDAKDYWASETEAWAENKEAKEAEWAQKNAIWGKEFKAWQKGDLEWVKAHPQAMGFFNSFYSALRGLGSKFFRKEEETTSQPLEQEQPRVRAQNPSRGASKQASQTTWRQHTSENVPYQINMEDASHAIQSRLASMDERAGRDLEKEKREMHTVKFNRCKKTSEILKANGLSYQKDNQIHNLFGSIIPFGLPAGQNKLPPKTIENIRYSLARALNEGLNPHNKEDEKQITPLDNIQIQETNTGGYELTIANAHRPTITFGTMIKTSQWEAMVRNKEIPITLGIDSSGAPLVRSLKEMKHTLVGGATGSGKSVMLNTILSSVIAGTSANDISIGVVDPKNEFGRFKDAPQMSDGIVRGERVCAYLKEKCKQMDEAVDAIGDDHDIDKYNERHPESPLKYHLIVIDEFQNLFGKDKDETKEIKHYIDRLTSFGRSAGVRVVLATQKPSQEVFKDTGIKANLVSKIAFRTTNASDSRVLMDEGGAEDLQGHGDMIFSEENGNKTHAQGTFTTDDMVGAVVETSRAMHIVGRTS